MELWWSELGTTLQVFYAIAIATTTLLVLQFTLMMFGFDGDGDIDGEVDVGHEHGDTGILSVRTISSFFTGFGWTGVACLEAGWKLAPTLITSVVVGGAFMAGVVFMMRTLYGMKYSGTLDYHNAVGQIGVVYLRIPGAMASPGQVEVKIQGRNCIVQAFTRSTDQIPNQSRVRVIELMDDNTVIVEPIDAPPSPQKEA